MLIANIMDNSLNIYIEVLDRIREQINLITYSNGLTRRERLTMLENLQVDINRKLGWAKASFSQPEKSRSVDSVIALVNKE